MTLDEIRKNWPAFIHDAGPGPAAMRLISVHLREINAINEMGRLLRTPGDLTTAVLAACHPDAKKKIRKRKRASK